MTDSGAAGDPERGTSSRREDPREPGPASGPLRVSLGYAVFGVLWIVLSDLLLHRREPMTPDAFAISIGKGLLFVGLSSLLIYILAHAAQRRLLETIHALRISEARSRHLASTLERRVRRRTRELEDAAHDLHAFNSSVSHDLRAPIRAIEGFGELLAERAGPRLEPRERELMTRLLEAAALMGQLVDDLLELGRIGGASVHREPLDLAPLARSVVEGLRRAEPARTVEVVIAPSLPADGDPGLLRIALVNLIGNAWKFTRRRENARIEVGEESVGGEREFYVRDNGAGFDPAQTGRMFEPFQRFHGRQEFGGTGIGLATVHRIVRHHGGTIRAEGAPGHGATFRFTLPAEEPADA